MKRIRIRYFKKCIIEDCKSKCHKQGYCLMHLKNPTAPSNQGTGCYERKMPEGRDKCIVDGCKKASEKGRLKCYTHRYKAKPNNPKELSASQIDLQYFGRLKMGKRI